MEWTKEAHAMVQRAPFFVRKRVRIKVEEEAQRQGAALVTPAHVETAQRRYLTNMEEEVKGCRIETCFGSGGCPNRIGDYDLAQDIEALPIVKSFPEFLKKHVKGPLKLHHELRISVSDCPNGCSRPHIADIGLIAAARPETNREECTHCGACKTICREGAIDFAADYGMEINSDKCLLCNQCVKICPAVAMRSVESGYRVLLGGKLGRHPQLAKDLGRIYSREEALAVVTKTIAHYMEHSVSGERLGATLNRTGLDFLNEDTKSPREAQGR